MNDGLVLTTTQEIAAFIGEFEARTLPKSRWHHQGHLVVGLWYLSHHSPEEALSIIRRRISAYNEVVGPPNSGTSGYHETLTRFYLQGIAAHLAAHRSLSLPESLAALLQSPLGNKDWPLTAYSRERLFSVAARRGWLEPDL
jgi:hypothetical protein